MAVELEHWMVASRIAHAGFSSQAAESSLPPNDAKSSCYLGPAFQPSADKQSIKWLVTFYRDLDSDRLIPREDNGAQCTW